ncbi:MAG: IS110 family transposase [Acidimicrobiia bacterium]
MDNRTHVGLDVHKESTAVAVLRLDLSEPDHRVIQTTPEAYRKMVKTLKGENVVFCYEAGPCGFGPYRILNSLGAKCDVIAPTLIPRRRGQRVKTDRIDARNLARLHRAGELTCVRVPTPEHEAVRDLIRIREDAKRDRRIAIQRLKSFLLRYGCRYPKAAQGWSLPYEQWVSVLELEQPHAQEALEQLIATVQTRHTQLVCLDRRIDELAVSPPLAEGVRILRVFRGIDTLSAATITAEVGDFSQFARAASFMSFMGLVPSEHSSGEREWRGSITKIGNAHVRRVLVEAAWAYRHRPAIGANLRKRQEGLPPELVAYSFKAQTRLHARYRKLSAIKASNVAVVAVARELAGFVWAAMRQRY